MRARLFWKLGLTYLILLFAVLVSVDFYAARILRETFIHDTDERLSALAQLAKSQPPPVDDGRALASWAAWMSRSGARVTVIAADGRVLADSNHDIETMENHSNRPEFRQAMANGEGESVRHSHTLDRDLVYRAMRLERPQQSAVVIRFAAPLAQINQAMSQVRGRLWAVSFLILVLGIAISIMFSRRFAGRVERLREFSRQVAEGDFRPLRPTDSSDELGDLARALNATAANLDTTIRSLTEERNRSAAILRSMAEGIAVVDGRGHVSFCNAAFMKIPGFAAAIPVENDPAIREIRQPQLLELIRQTLSGNEGLRAEISLGSVQPRSFSVTVAPVSSARRSAETDSGPEAPAPLGAVLVLHEVTDLRRLDQMRKDFVANVSHELRTPLTTIQGFAETLLSGALEDRQNSRHFVEIIRNQANRLSRLTDDLLKLSRIEAGRLETDFQPVDLKALITSTLDSERGAADQKCLSVTLMNPPQDFPEVVGDAGLLREVIRNLLDNAIRYTDRGGVEVSIARGNGVAIVGVADTGIGIPLAEQPRIFERFYRVDAARSREVGGTGLGLAIAKHIVESHGGQIWVESTVGEGSKFCFSLPLAP